jgi:FeS assembly SUF system protein
MTDDIEHLKTKKILRGPDGRVRLSQIGMTEPVDPVDEAFGGSGVTPTEPVDEAALRPRVIDALKSVHDPEIPLNIYDLGLIYGFTIDAQGGVDIDMTLTAPACPVAGMLVQEVARRVGEVDGVSRSHVKLVWDPPWSKDRMSDEALLELGLL